MKDKINEYKESMNEIIEVAQRELDEIGEILEIKDDDYYKWDYIDYDDYCKFYSIDSEEIESNDLDCIEDEYLDLVSIDNKPKDDNII